MVLGWSAAAVYKDARTDDSRLRNRALGADFMKIKGKVLVAAVAAGLAGAGALIATSALADECEAMTGHVKVLIDKTDPAAKGGNNMAKSCAAFGEGLGLIKSFRIVIDECLDEGDKRTEILAGLDRSIRQLQGEVDGHCK
jgi:hypothetical protein